MLVIQAFVPVGRIAQMAAVLISGISLGLAAAEEPQPTDKDAATAVYVLRRNTAAQSSGPVAVGQKLRVRAAGNATTGFQWSVQEIKGDAVISGGEVKYVQAKADGRVGVGGAFVIPLEGSKPGKAEVTLIYSRPFEKEKAPVETVVLTVEVRAADAEQDAAAPKRAKPLPILGKADPRAKGFVIMFQDNVDPKAEVERLEKLHGFKHRHLYTSAIKGFAAEMPEAVVEKLRWEPNIKLIERDAVVTTQEGGVGIE